MKGHIFRQKQRELVLTIFALAGCEFIYYHLFTMFI